MTEPEARRAQIEDFLARNGLADAPREALAGDASGRRYFRLRRGETTALLMDAPPQKPDAAAQAARLVQNALGPFLSVAAHLRARGFSAPAVADAEPASGLCLLEDFGDGSYARTLDRGGDPKALYSTAASALAQLAAEPAPAELAPYDDQALKAELAVLTDWWAPAFAAGRGADAQALFAVFEPPLARLRGAVERSSAVMTLRDVHADNLFWLPERDGHATVGLIDFQDALAGHPAYDFMSLVDDVRRDVPDAVIGAARTAYLGRRAELDGESFDAARAILGAQRQTKILGVFARLAFRDGKPAYLDHMPRVWRRLERALRHPDLVEVKRWFDDVAPARLRTARPPRAS